MPPVRRNASEREERNGPSLREREGVRTRRRQKRIIKSPEEGEESGIVLRCVVESFERGVRRHGAQRGG